MKELTRRAFIYGGATVASYVLLAGTQHLYVSSFAAHSPNSANPADNRKSVDIVKFKDNGVSVGLVSSPKIHKTIDEWKKLLTPLQFEVTRQAGTEAPFTGALDHEQA